MLFKAMRPGENAKECREKTDEPLNRAAGKMNNNQRRLLAKNGQRDGSNRRKSGHWESSDESVSRRE